MHAKDTLIRLKEWILNGTYNGVVTQPTEMLDKIDAVLKLPADINEAEVHKAIKPHLSPEQQGKVMGALRQVLDMYQPAATQHSVLHRTPQVHNAVITMLQDVVDGADGPVARIDLRVDLWQEVIEAIKRDREAVQALRYAGLHMVNTAHGYAVKPLQKAVVASS